MQAVYVQCNIEALSYNHCWSWKAVIITYGECVFVALSIQLVMSMCRTLICGLPGSTKFFHIISWMEKFKKKKVLEN